MLGQYLVVVDLYILELVSALICFWVRDLRQRLLLLVFTPLFYTLIDVSHRCLNLSELHCVLLILLSDLLQHFLVSSHFVIDIFVFSLQFSGPVIFLYSDLVQHRLDLSFTLVVVAVRIDAVERS